MKLDEKETLDLLSSLALKAGVEILDVDYDREIWVLRISNIEDDQIEMFQQSLENYELKFVALEFVK